MPLIFTPEQDELRTVVRKFFATHSDEAQVRAQMDSDSGYDTAVWKLMAEQLRSALDALTPREATIMAMRFGLYDGNPHTLDEIGRALGLTRERIRQLEKQSLSKLRHPSRAQPLLDFAS